MSQTAILTPVRLADRFARVIELLCRAVGAHGPRSPAASPLVAPAWSRLRRLCARFAALAAAVEAGRLAIPRSRRVAAPRQPGAPVTVGLPSGFGWLLRLAPHVDTRIGRSQVEHWLADPALAALVESAPQAGRILRPLCHMLAIEPPPALRLPKRRNSAAAEGAGAPASNPPTNGTGAVPARRDEPRALEAAQSGRTRRDAAAISATDPPPAPPWLRGRRPTVGGKEDWRRSIRLPWEKAEN